MRVRGALPGGGVMPKIAAWPTITAKAASDMATGTKALGCFIVAGIIPGSQVPVYG